VKASGFPGDEFFIVGKQFNRPGLSVSVCGMPVVDFDLLEDGHTIRLAAPACDIVGFAPVEVCNIFGCVVEAKGFKYSRERIPFRRGDANNDEVVDISDPIVILGDLFLGEPATAPCRDALDANDDGGVDISDAIFLLAFLFVGADESPYPPFSKPGLDPTPDTLPEC
jgi:hypothetical protein